MTHTPTPQDAPPFAFHVIPTLSQDLVMGDVPLAVSLALDARAAEKAALMALSEGLMEKMRPEIERLASDRVQTALQGEWEKRSRTYQEE
jgi:hypothetical protein